MPTGKHDLLEDLRIDQTGNWRRFWRDDKISAFSSTTQARSHSRSNRIQSISVTHGKTWHTPTYDEAGNVKSIPSPRNPSKAMACEYDGWNRLVKITDGDDDYSYTYDGLGRRIRKHVNSKSNGVSIRHYYYDDSDRVIAEFTETGGEIASSPDKEYIWDVSEPDRLVAIHCASGSTLYPVYDAVGNVKAIVDDEGDVLKRYIYDVQGNVLEASKDFEPGQLLPESPVVAYLTAGMRLDEESGLQFTGAGYYHSGLGRLLSTGQLGVLAESTLSSRAMGFPGGTPLPSLDSMSSGESILQFLAEMPDWLKVSIGAAGLLIAGCICIAAGPIGWVALGGAVAGAVDGGVEAALQGGKGADIFMSAGIGAAFGAVAPGAAHLGLAGAAVAGSIAMFSGASNENVAAAFSIGGLVGGMGHGFFKSGGALGIRWAGVRAGLSKAGGELLGAGVGATVGYAAAEPDHRLTGVLHGATIGMFVGGIAHGLGRRAWNVGRAKPRNVAVAETALPFIEEQKYAKANEIHWTHDDISWYTREDKTDLFTLSLLAEQGKLREPVLDVVVIEGKYFSLNNRRLAAYKMSTVQNVPIKIRDVDNPYWRARYRRANTNPYGGKYVKIRGTGTKTTPRMYMDMKGQIHKGPPLRNCYEAKTP